jgi:hypothetical protein
VKLPFKAWLVLTTVFGDEGVDRSEAADVVAVLRRPCFPFGQFSLQADASLSDHVQAAFRPMLGSYGSVEALFGLLAFTPPGEAAVAGQLSECFLGSLPFLPALGEVGEGPLLVPLERLQGVEGRTRRSVDDRGQPAPLGPEPIDGARSWWASRTEIVEGEGLGVGPVDRLTEPFDQIVDVRGAVVLFVFGDGQVEVVGFDTAGEARVAPFPAEGVVGEEEGLVEGGPLGFVEGRGIAPGEVASPKLGRELGHQLGQNLGPATGARPDARWPRLSQRHRDFCQPRNSPTRRRAPSSPGAP